MANKKLEKMLEKMKRQKINSISEEMMAELSKAKLVLPGILPRNISPEAMRQFIDSQNTNKPLPQGVNPKPCIIQSSQGESFLPLFTSTQEMNKGDNSFPLFLNVTFDMATEMMRDNPDLAGVVINPFTHNLLMKMNREKMSKEQPEETGEITLEQYHALARRQMESAYLPSRLFQEKGAFAEALSREKGRLMRELYEEIYQQEIACPYTEEDFEFITLNISEDFMVSQIIMPEKNRYPQLCRSVIYGFDREKNKIWYYAIVYEGREKPLSLVRVQENGEPENLGEAPPEGSEITRVMELMQEEK